MSITPRIIVPCLFLGMGMAIGLSLHREVEEVRAEGENRGAIPRELTSYRDIVKRVVPAVVCVESKTRDRRNEKEAPKGTSKVDPYNFGSGFIVDPKGVILTNYHVVEGADSVDVYLNDGRVFTTRDIRGDRKTDLAIIRISSQKPFPFLEFGDSDQMEVGDRVLAVGAPFGLTGSVTHGIISAKSRNVRINLYEDFLQTDAAINPGNSGGPLVSLEGKVIGINSAIKSKTGGFQGVGLSISSKLTKSIMADLLKTGRVKRGYLGIQIKEMDAKLAERYNVREGSGVLISGIYQNSPATKSQLKLGDVIVRINGKDVRNGDDLSEIVARLTIDQPTEIVLIRNGQTMSVKVKIEEQPEEFGIREER